MYHKTIKNNGLNFATMIIVNEVFLTLAILINETKREYCN